MAAVALMLITRLLQGTDEQGNFRTSPSKQYPSELNKCLALASYEFIHDHFSPSHDLDYDTFAESIVAKFYVPLDH